MFVDTTQMTGRGKELYLRGTPAGRRPGRVRQGLPGAGVAQHVRRRLLQSDRKRIFILRVDRPDLTPAMRVTAAYEMLHAAYAALAPSDRKRCRLDGGRCLPCVRDERLRALSGELAALPARDRLDALHSLLGTQVAQLPDDLEHYYSSLFQDRQSVVSAFWSYKSAFDALDSQLDRSVRRSTG